MSSEHNQGISRRRFVAQSGVAAGGVLLGGAAAANGSSPPEQAIPQRVLGRTNVPITAMTLGTAPCGQSRDVSTQQVADIVDEALNQGIASIDTARLYGNAEEGIGRALGRRRKDVFLATKIWADTVDDAERAMSESLKALKTDYVDLLYFHNLGNRNVETAMGADGVFTWIQKQKELGKTRFVGISGHNLSERFPAFIETGEVDVVLMVLNFVDRYIYGFERKILPLARKHNLGVIAMKVFGGIQGGFRNYGGPPSPPQMDTKYLDLAVRYTLGLPGVTSVNIGVHCAEQVRENVKRVKRYQALSREELDEIARIGQTLSPQWGPHFGPAAAPVRIG